MVFGGANVTKIRRRRVRQQSEDNTNELKKNTGQPINSRLPDKSGNPTLNTQPRKSKKTAKKQSKSAKTKPSSPKTVDNRQKSGITTETIIESTLATPLPKPNPPKTRPGRPSHYKPEYARMAREIVKHSGCGEAHLAEIFNVSTKTVYAWKKNHEEFSKAIQAGKDAFNVARSEDCMIKRIMGYNYVEKVITRNAKGQVIETVEHHRHVPPDIKFLKFYLVNRSPRWKNIDKVEITGKNGGPVEHRHGLADPKSWAAVMQEILSVGQQESLPNGRQLEILEQTDENEDDSAKNEQD